MGCLGTSDTSSRSVRVRVHRLDPAVYPPTDPAQVVMADSAPARPTAALAHIILNSEKASMKALCERVRAEAANLGAEVVVVKTDLTPVPFGGSLRTCTGVALRYRESGQGITQQARPAAAAASASDVDIPGYHLPERPDDYALVIGVEGYAAVRRAELAERDAQAVRKHLEALGYPARNVVFLTGDQAGRAAIAKYVESWLPLNVTERSLVFVYFAGHGAPDPKTQQAYLLPWDGDPRFLENTGYPLQRFYQKLASLKAREVIVALDASFSGTGERSVLPPGARPLVTRVAAGVPPGGKVAVLSACTPEESAAVFGEQGHGLFTYYLLKGLQEARGSEGGLRLSDLHRYVSAKVGEIARSSSRDQSPQLLGSDSAQVLRP